MKGRRAISYVLHQILVCGPILSLIIFFLPRSFGVQSSAHHFANGCNLVRKGGQPIRESGRRNLSYFRVGCVGNHRGCVGNRGGCVGNQRGVLLSVP